MSYNYEAKEVPLQSKSKPTLYDQVLATNSMVAGHTHESNQRKR